MNNEQRRQWILNDEGLYNLYRDSKKSLQVFIKENRQIIDEVINNVTTNKKPAHYLVYR